MQLSTLQDLLRDAKEENMALEVSLVRLGCGFQGKHGFIGEPS